MGSVLITRPSPDGEQLCESLRELGVGAVHQPLITFTQGKDFSLVESQLQKADIAIFVSKPAVEWADKFFSNTPSDWPEKLIYLAVGQKTADKLSKCIQQTVNYPKISDSEHFLELPELLDVNNKRVVIIRGNGGRELIKLNLSKRGALVEYCEVYERQALTFNGHSKVVEWQQNGVCCIVVTSSEQLVLLSDSIPQSHLSWLHEQHMLVPSKRIADAASDIGFKNVNITGSASNPDLIATIQSLSTIGHTHDK